MARARNGTRRVLALGWCLVLAAFAACDVYNESLLTGAASGGRDTNAGSAGSGGDQTGGDAGTQGGTSAGNGGRAGSTTVGGGGGTAGRGGSPSVGGTTATGGTDDMGGEGGQDGGETGGSAGGGVGGMAGGGTAGSGGGGNCGVCGCDVAEVDTDMDGVADCNDTCEGYPDADCDAIRNGLVHRYSFSGTGTTAVDSVGTADGTILNATLTGTGSLTLTGGDTSTPPYVDLPNGIVSALTNATLELWVTWNQGSTETTGQNWQRIFDFGTSGTEGMQGSSPQMYLFLTARTGTSNFLRATYTLGGIDAETSAEAQMELPRGTKQHVVVTIDDTNDELALYLGGVRQSAEIFLGALSGLTDVNNWLARSQYTFDYEFKGTYDEFRIYDVALTSGQVLTSSMAGPDPSFLP